MQLISVDERQRLSCDRHQIDCDKHIDESLQDEQCAQSHDEESGEVVGALPCDASCTPEQHDIQDSYCSRSDNAHLFDDDGVDKV